MSKKEIRICDRDGKIITGNSHDRQTYYFQAPWESRRHGDYIAVTIKVYTYRHELMDLCKKCQRSVFRKIFTRPVRTYHDPHEDGAPAASGTLYIPPCESTPLVSNHRMIYFALLLCAAAGYICYLTWFVR